MVTSARHAYPVTPGVLVFRCVTAVALRVLRVVVAGTLLLLLLGLIVGKLVLHMGLSPVLTGSMRPTFAPGDAVITRVVPVAAVRPGTIAVFIPPGESAPFAHRVMTVSQSAKGPVVTTKGDANPAADAWHAVLTRPRVSVVIAHVPKLGYAVVALHQRQWRAALIGLIGLAMTFVATRSALRSTSSGPRVAHGARP